MHCSSPFSYGLFCLGLTALALPLGAIQPEALAERLGQAKPPRIIDVRATHEFEIAHIPGALNIPLEVLSRRTLPPLGEVVVVADGQGVVDPAAAVAILNAKPGITADVLEGGLAAWESGQRPSTRASGLSQESLPGITYQQLLNGKESNLVLVDLRAAEVSASSLQVSPATRSVASSTVTAITPVNNAALGPDPIANLAGKLRGARVAGDPFAPPDTLSAVAAVSTVKGQSAPPSVKAATPAAASTPTAAPVTIPAGVAPLLVLIDQGDGRAQETARRLLASGNRRFVILSGGVEAVRLEGHSMVERTGGAVNLGRSTQ